jgi:hypothetical protein
MVFGRRLLSEFQRDTAFFVELLICASTKGEGPGQIDTNCEHELYVVYYTAKFVAARRGTKTLLL